MSRRLQTFAAATAFVFAAHAAGAQAVKQQGSSAAATRSAINAAWDRAIAEGKAGRVDVLLAWYTPDAIVVHPPMKTVTGKANIDKMIRDYFATAKLLDMTRQETNFEQYGDIAISMGTYSQTFQEKGKSTPTKFDGRYTIIFKNVDGKWLVHRDIGTPMPPAPTKK